MENSKRKTYGKNKRVLSVLLAAMLIGSTVVTTGSFTGIGISASAVTDTATTSESDFLYSTKSDGTIMITDYTGSSEDVVIPSKIDGKNVTEIFGAFYNCKDIKSVSIPSGVKKIGDQAFMFCESLNKVNIPSSVTSIGCSAFYNCKSLESIKIPDSVEIINTNAFYNCKGLKSVTIGGGVKSIGITAFSGCTALESVIIGEGVKSIGMSAFSRCKSLRVVLIPKSVTEINNEVFTFSNDFLLYGYKGSYAETYAYDNNITFVNMLLNKSTISSTSINKGNTVTLKAVASDGAAPYQYYFSVKHSTASSWTTLKGYNTNSTLTWKPGLVGTYQVCAKVKDANGVIVAKFFTLNVKGNLTNYSTISKTTINKGDTISLKGVAAGGTAAYKYAFTVRHSTAKEWTVLKSYNTTATKNWKPAKTGTYQVCAKVKDAKGTEVKKFFTLTVK